MKHDPILPICPVCTEETRSYVYDRPDHPFAESKITHVQNITFQCGASYSRRAERKHGAPEEIYGRWSEWRTTATCSRAQEVALKLIEEKRLQEQAKAS